MPVASALLPFASCFFGVVLIIYEFSPDPPRVQSLLPECNTADRPPQFLWLVLSYWPIMGLPITARLLARAATLGQTVSGMDEAAKKGAILDTALANESGMLVWLQSGILGNGVVSIMQYRPPLLM